MSDEFFISVISLVITCLGFGYMIGKDINHKQK